MQIEHDRHKGFTLVEMAIVMVIVGLIIGGVLQGQQLLENARVNYTVSQVSAYKAALLTFREKYSSLPGDMPTARQRLPGCTASNNCYNGDGNGRIGPYVEIWHGSPTVSQNRNSENQQFWTHLAIMGMIPEIVPYSNEVAWGSSHPRSRYPGGFSLINSRDAGVASPSGLWLRLHSSLYSENAEHTGDGYSALSPYQGAAIDRKMDDGDPNSGYVRGFQYGNPPSGAAHNCEYQYDETSHLRTCTMAFKLDN